MIAADGGGSRMPPHQLMHEIEAAFRIGTAVDEIADEDEPALFVIGQAAELVQNDFEFIGLSMHVADDGDRTLNARREIHVSRLSGQRGLRPRFLILTQTPFDIRVQFERLLQPFFRGFRFARGRQFL